MPTSPLFNHKVVFLGAVNFTVSTTVVSCDPTSIPNGASGVVISIENGGGVNWLPAQDPTTTLGVPMSVGDSECIEHEPISDLRFIRRSSSDSVVSLLFIACINNPD